MRFDPSAVLRPRTIEDVDATLLVSFDALAQGRMWCVYCSEDLDADVFCNFA